MTQLREWLQGRRPVKTFSRFGIQLMCDGVQFARVKPRKSVPFGKMARGVSPYGRDHVAERIVKVLRVHFS